MFLVIMEEFGESFINMCTIVHVYKGTSVTGSR